MSVRLFVGNLPYDATEDEIRDHFATAGNVASVFIPVDRETGRKRGFAFVEFDTQEKAQEAIRLFNSQPFKGRALAVNEARARESRPAPSGGGAGGGGFRPSPGPRPAFTPRPSIGSAPDFGSDPTGRGSDRPSRKFGPDAKPSRNRQKTFKSEGKRPFKEKLGGQIYSTDDEEEVSEQDTEVDNFATSADDEGDE